MRYAAAGWQLLLAQYNITRFKSLKVALKELEPFLRNVTVGKQ